MWLKWKLLPSLETTSNVSHLRGTSSFSPFFKGDMLVPWRVLTTITRLKQHPGIGIPWLSTGAKNIPKTRAPGVEPWRILFPQSSSIPNSLAQLNQHMQIQHEPRGCSRKTGFFLKLEKASIYTYIKQKYMRKSRYLISVYDLTFVCLIYRSTRKMALGIKSSKLGQCLATLTCLGNTSIEMPHRLNTNMTLIGLRISCPKTLTYFLSNLIAHKLEKR